MKKQVVISLANNRGNYLKSLARLDASLQKYWKGDTLLFTSESQVGAPKHEDNHYAFKVFAFREAVRKGYTKILWVDSSVYAVKKINRIFAFIERDGYVMQEAGHYVGDWCNDRTLQYFQLSREAATTLPMYGNAGLLGLDFTAEISRKFFAHWERSMNDGMFNGSWENHRHDMTCGSIIANYLEMKYQPGNTLLQYAAPEDKPINDSIIFYAQGL